MTCIGTVESDVVGLASPGVDTVCVHSTSHSRCRHRHSMCTLNKAGHSRPGCSKCMFIHSLHRPGRLRHSMCTVIHSRPRYDRSRHSKCTVIHRHDRPMHSRCTLTHSMYRHSRCTLMHSMDRHSRPRRSRCTLIHDRPRQSKCMLSQSECRLSSCRPSECRLSRHMLNLQCMYCMSRSCWHAVTGVYRAWLCTSRLTTDRHPSMNKDRRCRAAWCVARRLQASRRLKSKVHWGVGMWWRKKGR